jgi:hypothetical protein
LKVTKLPLFLLAVPQGDSLKTCVANSIFQGEVTESALVAALETIRGPPPPADPIREEQDQYFLEALQDDIRRNEERQIEERRRQEQSSRAADEKERIEREFAELPDLSPADRFAVSVKFKFDDNSEKVKVFPRTGPVSMLYVFVRKYEYPRSFVLKTGFPTAVLPECDAALEEFFRERSVLVHVADAE